MTPHHLLQPLVQKPVLTCPVQSSIGRMQMSLQRGSVSVRTHSTDELFHRLAFLSNLQPGLPACLLEGGLIEAIACICDSQASVPSLHPSSLHPVSCALTSSTRSQTRVLTSCPVNLVVWCSKASLQ